MFTWAIQISTHFSPAKVSTRRYDFNGVRLQTNNFDTRTTDKSQIYDISKIHFHMFIRLLTGILGNHFYITVAMITA